MPIQTDSEAWETGDEPESLTLRVIDFLKEHPDKAFRKRELAEEVLDIEWSEYEAFMKEWEENKKSLDEDEFREWRAQEDREMPSYPEHILMNYFTLRLRKLVEEDLLEVRIVDGDAFDQPHDMDEVTCITYNVP